MSILSEVTPFAYDLAQFFPQAAAKSVLSVLTEKYEEYLKRPKTFPGLEMASF